MPALWFLAIRGFMGAVNRPEPGLWITIVAIPANAVLVYLLIHGELDKHPASHVVAEFREHLRRLC